MSYQKLFRMRFYQDCGIFAATLLLAWFIMGLACAAAPGEPIYSPSEGVHYYDGRVKDFGTLIRAEDKGSIDTLTADGIEFIFHDDARDAMELADKQHRLTMCEKQLAGQKAEIIELKRKVAGMQKQITILHAKIAQKQQQQRRAKK